MRMKLSGERNCCWIVGEARPNAAPPSSRWKAASCCSTTARIAARSPVSSAAASSALAGATKMRRSGRRGRRRIAMSRGRLPISRSGWRTMPPQRQRILNRALNAAATLLSRVDPHLVARRIGEGAGGKADAIGGQAHVGERLDDALDVALGCGGVAGRCTRRGYRDDVEGDVRAAIERLVHRAVKGLFV